MKNVHLITTDKPSRFYFIKSNNKLGITSNNTEFTENFGCGTQNQHIYITDNSEKRDGDWYFDGTDLIRKKTKYNDALVDGNKDAKKIIMTTDQDLIADGIQAIDDEFLEWFVKNSSCEFVEVERETIIEYEPIGHAGGVYEYKIIIPKEEPNIIDQWLEKNDNSEIDKQVEEAAENHWKMQYIMALDESTKPYIIQDFIAGAKWQQEQDKNKYSEEEVLSILEDYDREFKLNTFAYTVPCRFTVREWFEKKTKL